MVTLSNSFLTKNKRKAQASIFFILTSSFLLLSLTSSQKVGNTEDRVDTPEKAHSNNQIKSIEFQNRHGNVVTSKIYIVNLANGSEFKYSKTIPGPGMLCDTDNPKGSCEKETEKGYEEIDSMISSPEFRKKEDGFSTNYYPEKEKCITDITEETVEISDCS